MHATSVTIHRAGALRTPGGGLDVEAYKRAVGALLHRVPRYRQKLRRVPFERNPVWIDDPHFNLDYHIRHASLPRPGSVEELKKKVARIQVQPLDRGKPLWESWLIEGLEGDRFAVIRKLHHCMLDAEHPEDLAELLLAGEGARSGAIPRYLPRPEPTGIELLGDAWKRRLLRPFDALGRLRDFARASENLRSELAERASALAAQLVGATRRPLDSPLSGAIGPHRRVDWFSSSLDDLKALRRALGCSLHDVVLATLAGAVRDFFLYRHLDPEAVAFRVSTPVGAGAGHHPRVSSWQLELPIGEPDPLARARRIREETERLRESRHALGVETMLGLAEWTPSVLLSLGARALASPVPAQLTLMSVPGPVQRRSLLGCELLEWYAAYPLLEPTGLSIALVSYCGRMGWCFNADRDLVPDLARFVKGVESAFEELSRAAGVDVKGLPAEAGPRRAASRGRASARRAPAG